MYLVCHKSLVKACPAEKKVLIPYRHILEPFLLFFKNYGVDRLFSKSNAAQALVKRIESINQEKNDKGVALKRIADDVEKNGNMPKTILTLLSKIESQIEALEIEEQMLLVQIASSAASDSIKEEITRSDIEEFLETEEGRLKFNAVLTDNNIEVLVEKRFDEEYSSMFISFKNEGFSENVRFNRKEAIIPLQGVYNYNKKTFNDVDVKDLDHDEFEIDWSL